MKKFPTIQLTAAPVHVVQYRHSPHYYGCIFTTRATTTQGIARAAARAAREDIAYWTNRRDIAPEVTAIDGVALIYRDWEDQEMHGLIDLVNAEASKPRPPRMHESAERTEYHRFSR